MKGTILAYKFLGDIEKINKNPGECVLDYILHQTKDIRGLKHINRPFLIKVFVRIV